MANGCIGAAADDDGAECRCCYHYCAEDEVQATGKRRRLLQLTMDVMLQLSMPTPRLRLWMMVAEAEMLLNSNTTAEVEVLLMADAAAQVYAAADAGTQALPSMLHRCSRLPSLSL
jgi:hypothetical protein